MATASEGRVTPAETRSRLQLEELHAAYEIEKDRLILRGTIAIVVIVSLFCIVVLSLTEKPNLQNWATAALTSLLTGCVGYWTGKQGKP